MPCRCKRQPMHDATALTQCASVLGRNGPGTTKAFGLLRRATWHGRTRFTPKHGQHGSSLAGHARVRVARTRVHRAKLSQVCLCSLPSNCWAAAQPPGGALRHAVTNRCGSWISVHKVEVCSLREVMSCFLKALACVVLGVGPLWRCPPVAVKCWMDSS